MSDTTKYTCSHGHTVHVATGMRSSDCHECRKECRRPLPKEFSFHDLQARFEAASNGDDIEAMHLARKLMEMSESMHERLRHWLREPATNAEELPATCSACSVAKATAWKHGGRPLVLCSVDSDRVRIGDAAPPGLQAKYPCPRRRP